MFTEAKDDGGGGDNWTTGTISCAKLQPNHQHQQTNIQFFTGRMPFLSPNQHWRENDARCYLALVLFFCSRRYTNLLRWWNLLQWCKKIIHVAGIKKILKLLTSGLGGVRVSTTPLLRGCRYSSPVMMCSGPASFGRLSIRASSWWSDTLVLRRRRLSSPWHSTPALSVIYVFIDIIIIIIIIIIFRVFIVKTTEIFQPWARAVCTLPAVPMSTQPSTLCGTVNEYQLLGWVIGQ